jgi:hypothetical protein
MKRWRRDLLVLGVTAVACASASLVASEAAHAFTDQYRCQVHDAEVCGQGNFHSITYNRVFTTGPHTRLCVGMQTEAGNHRGGKNFCGSNVNDMSECFSSPTPMSQAFGFFLDEDNPTFAQINGSVDDSTNHTGCISLTSASLGDTALAAGPRIGRDGASDGAAARAFSVFRRLGGPGLVDAGKTAKAYAVTESDGDVCMVLATATVTSAGCAPPSSAASERPILLSGVDGGVPVTVGLLYDGPSRVDVARPGARSKRSQAVDGNVFVVRGRATSVSWQDRSGTRHTQSLAVAAAVRVSG